MSKIIGPGLLGLVALVIGLVGCVLGVVTNKPAVFQSCGICAAISILPLQRAWFAYEDWRDGDHPPFDWHWNMPVFVGSALIALFIALFAWLAK